jgi:hypothetical protein
MQSSSLNHNIYNNCSLINITPTINTLSNINTKNLTCKKNVTIINRINPNIPNFNIKPANNIETELFTSQ